MQWEAPIASLMAPFRSIRALLILTSVFSIAPLRADRAGEVRAQIGQVADSLSAGNAADAMSPFSKSFPNYEKLSNYFQALTASFAVQNEIGIVDEQDDATETKVTINWTLTLTEVGTGSSEQRTEDVTARLQLIDKKWTIVDFSPISLFDPLRKRTPKQ